MLEQERTIEQWVDYIQTLHHREIELSLERVRQVYQRLYPEGVKYKVITVAGTNGKGSTAEIISSIYTQAGISVGKFSSPHLVNFSERYLINGQNVSEQELIDAFIKIEKARAEIPITYFEFGTLLAIELFAASDVSVAVMEVGLGGRLDAINILDADVAIITSISIDHTAWLGNTIEKIAREKVGIARSNKPCIVGIRQPARSIIEHCNAIGADLQILGRDFDFTEQRSDESCEVKELDQLPSSLLANEKWSWNSELLDSSVNDLPFPFLQSGVQLSNASLALQAVSLLNDELPFNNKAIKKGIEKASILARCQIVSESPLIVLDVAHNESSMSRLRQFIDQKKIDKEQDKKGNVYAVCGMLQDKEVGASLACLSDLVSGWRFATIHNDRGASAQYLSGQLKALSQDSYDSESVEEYDSITQAFNDARKGLSNDDILVVFGSFFVAGDILNLINEQT